MLGNNETNVILTKDSESQNHTKHINIIYHNVRGLMEDGKLGIK